MTSVNTTLKGKGGKGGREDNKYKAVHRDVILKVHVKTVSIGKVRILRKLFTTFLSSA